MARCEPFNSKLAAIDDAGPRLSERFVYTALDEFAAIEGRQRRIRLLCAAPGGGIRSMLEEAVSVARRVWLSCPAVADDHAARCLKKRTQCESSCSR